MEEDQIYRDGKEAMNEVKERSNAETERGEERRKREIWDGWNLEERMGIDGRAEKEGKGRERKEP